MLGAVNSRAVLLWPLAVAATAAKATSTATRPAVIMIQQQQLVNINLLFPLLLSNTDISHGGDLRPKVGDAVEKNILHFTILPV